MELSLSKLPWYGQIGAFVVVCGLAVFGFWKFYVVGDAGRHRAAADASDGADGRRRAGAWRRRGGCREFQAEVTELERRLENLQSRAAGAEGRRRHPAARAGAGDAVEPDDPALHAAAAEAGGAVRGTAVQADGRGDVPRPRALLRSRSASSRGSSTSARSRSRRGRSRNPRSPSSPSSSRRRSSCRKARRRRGGRGGRGPSCRSSRPRNEQGHRVA